MWYYNLKRAVFNKRQSFVLHLRCTKQRINCPKSASFHIILWLYVFKITQMNIKNLDRRKKKMIKEILNNDLSEALSGVSVVDFSATWCGPCSMLKPIMDELSDEFDSKAKFYSVDTDENGELCSDFGVNSIPAVFIMKDGKISDSFVGYQSKETVKEKIEAVL